MSFLIKQLAKLVNGFRKQFLIAGFTLVRDFMATLYCTYDRNFALHYSERLESIRVLEMDRRSVLMIRVKVNSKSELVEDREGKFALYLCNLLL